MIQHQKIFINLVVFMRITIKKLNPCLELVSFRSEPKSAEAILIDKKKDRKDKNNNIVVCILYNVSKKYERFMQEQLDKCFANAFCQGYSAQHCLVILIKKLIAVITDKKVVFAAVLTDLCQTLSCISNV